MRLTIWPFGISGKLIPKSLMSELTEAKLLSPSIEFCASRESGRSNQTLTSLHTCQGDSDLRTLSLIPMGLEHQVKP
jgi:hypothetical protein